MKISITFLAISLLLLNSCSFKFKARNMPIGLKDYTAYSNGDTIYVDGTKTTIAPINEPTKPKSAVAKNKPKTPPALKVTEMKTGKSFDFFVNDTKYTGLYYGKLNVVGRVEGYWVSSNGHKDPSWTYYLQKRGTSTVLPYTSRNLINAVSDNERALRAARATKIYSAITIPSALLFIGGLTSSILVEEGPLKSISATAGLLAIPVFFISMPLANAKFNKTIKIYNKR